VLLCVDPDPVGGSWVLLDPHGTVLASCLHQPVDELVAVVDPSLPLVVVEDVQSYGMPAGRSMFDTAKVIGELRGACRRECVAFEEISRPAVKAMVCRSAKAKDAHVRQAILDAYPPDGGGKTPQIGTKRQPGPLYGISQDLWAALALGLTALAHRNLGPIAERDGLTRGEPG
jgi:hypothetical protein